MTDPRPKPLPALRLAGAAALLALLAACGDGGAPPRQAAAREHLVEVARVEAARLDAAGERSGTLRPLREARLYNEETGRIVELSVRAGDRVAAGQVLVRYDQALLAAQHAKARAAAEAARSEHRRNADLVARGFVSAEGESQSRAALDIAEAEERLLATRLSYLTLRAPFAGVIAERLAEPGDVTPAHRQLLRIIDLTQLIADVEVDERIHATLRVGDTATVRIDALAGEHRGRIVRIHPTIAPATRSGVVEVALDPLPAGARPGQFARVRLRGAGEAKPVAPLPAIQRDAGGDYVYVLVDGNPPKVARRTVRTGLRLADRVEILDGVAAGEAVVHKGFLGLADGKAVRVVGQAPER